MTQASEIVIDLGEMPDRNLDKLAPDHRARWARPWLAAICVVVLVGSVAGSVAPAPPSPWATPYVISAGLPADADVVIAGDLLIAPELEPRGSITAWDLQGRNRRWSFQTDLERLFDAEMISGLVVLSGHRHVSPGDGAVPVGPYSRTYAVDPATGAARWDRPGIAIVLGRSPDRLLLLEDNDHGSVIAAVDPASGAELWRYDGPDEARFALTNVSLRSLREPAPRVNEALLKSSDGALFTLSLITGETTRIGSMPVAAAIMHFDDTTITMDLPKDTDGDPTNGHEESVVVTYDRATLRELWRTAGGTAGDTYFGRCGELICETNGSRTTARDVRTGRAVWSAGVLPNTVWPRPGGDLLLAQLPESSEMVLLDPATGRERFRPGRWHIIGKWDAGLLVGLPSKLGELPWIGLIPATGDPRIRPISALGAAGTRLDKCMVEHGWLVCVVFNNVVVVNLAEAMRGR